MEPRHVCLRCRALLAEGEACDVCGADAVVAVATAFSRAHPRDEVWHVEVRERRVTPEQLFGVFSAGMLVFVIAATIYGVKTQSAFLGTAMFWGPVVWVAALFGFLLAPRTPPRVLRPRGAAVVPAPPDALPRIRGRIAREDAGPRGHAFELRLADGGVTLRHAETPGFVLEVDEQQRVRVPAGRVRVRWPDAPAAAAEALRRLGGGASKRPVTDAPFDDVWELELAEGDEVELAARTVAEVSPAEDYRSPASRTEDVVGIAWVRPL